jgi:hypothetical protein
MIRLPVVKLPKVFATVVAHSQFLRTVDVLPYRYEVLVTKFGDFLAYRYQRYNDPQRWIFALDRKRAQKEKGM